jgi:hypothetical protein
VKRKRPVNLAFTGLFSFGLESGVWSLEEARPNIVLCSRSANETDAEHTLPSGRIGLGALGRFFVRPLSPPCKQGGGIPALGRCSGLCSSSLNETHEGTNVGSEPIR